MYYLEKYGLNDIDMVEEAKAKIIETLENSYDGYLCDLHDAVFNEEYYYCYTSEAKNELESYDVFDIIAMIVEYEKDNFGEVNTDFSNPCQVGNMLWYIVGEEVLNDMFDGCEEFDELWNGELTEEECKVLLQWLKDNGRY